MRTSINLTQNNSEKLVNLQKQFQKICPRSSVDRAVASGAMRAGSIPAGGTGWVLITRQNEEVILTI